MGLFHRSFNYRECCSNCYLSQYVGLKCRRDPLVLSLLLFFQSMSSQHYYPWYFVLFKQTIENVSIPDRILLKCSLGIFKLVDE